MATDNTIINQNTTVGDTIATYLDASDVKHEKVIVEYLDGVTPTMVSAANPLPVSASIDTTGLATSAKQDTGNASLASIDGKLTNPLPISGTVTANTGLTQPLTDTQLRATPVPVSGTITFPSATTATLSNVNDTNVSTTLLASNAARKMAVIYNDSTVALYIKFGATASATSFTVKVLAQGYYELPIPVYTGLIDGVWDSNQSGAARVTEW